MEYINEETDNIFYELLTEEMGVIRKVQNDADILSLKIQNAIQTSRSRPTSMDLTTFKMGEMDAEVNVSPDNDIQHLKKEIKIIWYYYGFYNKQIFDKYISNVGQTRYAPLINTLFVSVIAVNGKIDDETLKGGIAHELTHNFQCINRGKPLLSTDKKSKIYNNSNANIGNQMLSFKILAVIVYLSFNFEQDAYLNSAYSYVVKECEKGQEFLAIYSQTEAYGSLIRMREYLNILGQSLKNNSVGPLTRQHCNEQYNMTPEQLYKLGEKAYKRYARKLARMCGQALNDIKKKEMRNGIMLQVTEFRKPNRMSLTEMRQLENVLNIMGK